MLIFTDNEHIITRDVFLINLTNQGSFLKYWYDNLAASLIKPHPLFKHVE